MHGWTDPLDHAGAGRLPAQGAAGCSEQAASGRSARGLDTGDAPFPAVEEITPAGATSGRHRHRRRLAGPPGLAAAAAVLLVALGVGAALLPPSLTDRLRPASSGGAAAGAGGAQPGVGPVPSGSPTPAPTVTGSPLPTTSPTRITPPPPRRSPTKTPPKPANDGTGASAREQQVLAIVNRERNANGCGAVKINSRLATAARLHSQDQAAHNTMSHTGSDGSSPWQRAERAGYDDAIGENVAMGYRTPAAVMDGWMNSPGHRANILNCKAKAIGVGVAAAGNGSLYWTQMFGSVA